MRLPSHEVTRGCRGKHRMMLNTNTFTTSSQLSQCLRPLIQEFPLEHHHGKFSTQHHGTRNHQPISTETSKAWLLAP